MAELLVAVAVHDGVEDGAGHAHQVAADEQLDHRLAVHALRRTDKRSFIRSTSWGRYLFLEKFERIFGEVWINWFILRKL